ncbi:alpha-(1-_3)-arabinofuranosyltransferase domain-containing protein [Pedococcus soli]
MTTTSVETRALARPGTDAADPEDVVVWRARLLAVCLALAAVAFRQKPGLVVADTKLDLTVSPWAFLGKALHLWDPQGAFGQLQNQAYGYLFPMGPFHGVLTSLGVAPWVVQRLWWTTLLCVAFLGVWRLATELRIGTPWLRLAGAVAFALSPRIASELTVTSVEVWPMAVAPWVLLPLVVRGERTWPWRVSRSALAFFACGGVNAVASGVALVLPTLWFLTRRPTRRVALAFAGWLGAVVAAMAWWLLPLAVLGGNSPPFLDWIEGSGVTTSTASVFETLRGTSAWLGFLTTPTGPEWPGGWAHVTQPGTVLATVVIAAVGLLGLGLRRTPERTFLGVSVLVGMVLLGLGHSGALGSPVADGVQGLLDGALAAVRNTHKFDVVVRLPLALGLVAALSAGTQWLQRAGAARWVAPVTVLSLLVMATAPSAVAGLARSEAYTAVPGYWHETADWLDAQPDAGSVLVLPAASFADFTWGSTKDDPLQALMKRPFAVRDAVPLGSAGATRWLDGVERQLGAGRGGTGVTEALATAGVRFVVVRNDLRLDAQGDPLVAVHAGLAASGLDRVADFGPVAGNPGESEADTVDYRTLLPRPTVEVYRVPGAAGASMQSMASVPRITAGPEDAADVAGQAGPRLGLYGSDAAASGSAGTDVATDGLRRREANFGEPTHNTSAVLTATEPTRQDRPVTDFDSDPRAPRTTSTWTGIAGVRASSSASDAGATLRLGPSAAPGAALDGDTGTRWVSGTFGSATGEWLQVDLDSAREVRGVRIDVSVASPVAARPAELTVTTERGSRRAVVDQDGNPVVVGLPAGPTRWVRVTLDKVRSGAQNGFAIDELTLDGVRPAQLLQVPAAQSPSSIVLRRDDGSRAGCLLVAPSTYCSPTLALAGEGSSTLARRVTVGTARQYGVSGTVLAVSSPGTDRLFDVGERITATSSSRLVDGPADRPGAALDRDLGTGWVAGTEDFDPSFTLRLPERRTISALQFLRDPGLAASGARAVTVSFDGGRAQDAEVDDEGYLRFTARRARTVELRFGATRPMVNIDSRSGARTFIPVGFSELRVLGADDLRRPVDPEAVTGVPCGFGPTLTVNGAEHTTEVSGTLGDLQAGRPLAWSVCRAADPVDRDSAAAAETVQVRLDAGTNDIVATPSGEFAAQSLTLQAPGAAAHRYAASTPTALTVARPEPSGLSVALPVRTEDQLLAVAQNFHPGWTATVDGASVRGVRVNGWMQGWVVPAGSAAVLRADFAPDGSYRAGLAAGGVAVLALGLLALLTARSPRVRRALRRPVHAGATGHEPPAAGVLPRWIGVPVLVVTGLVIAGPVGAALGLLAAPVGLATGWFRAVLRTAVLALPLSAGVLVALHTWPGGRLNLDSPVVQALSLAGVLLGCGLALLAPAGERRRGREIRPATVRG